MFNSTSNNFGAGTIQFKDVQENNYIVLNAKFTCNPQDEAYKAADVLEITIPTLTISRSTEAAVVVRYKERPKYSGKIYAYDAGTFVKSWIKDANTLCIEKLSIFDDRTELIIYIHALYCQLAQDSNATKGKQKRIACISENDFFRASTSDTFVVEFKKWVFFHLAYESSDYSMRNADWDVFLENFPEDINVEVPFICGRNGNNDLLGGINEIKIQDGYLGFPASERNIGIGSTGNDPFVFVYLVRDYDTTPEVEGRLHYENEMLQQGKYSFFKDVDLELIPTQSFVSFTGTMGVYSEGPVAFPAPDFPEEIPSFDAFFLAAHLHSNGLTVQLLEIQVTKTDGNTTIKVIDQSGDKNLAFKLFDTTIPVII